jgi:hypothetical protein
MSTNIIVINNLRTHTDTHTNAHGIIKVHSNLGTTAMFVWDNIQRPQHL